MNGHVACEVPQNFKYDSDVCGCGCLQNMTISWPRLGVLTDSGFQVRDGNIHLRTPRQRSGTQEGM